MFKMSRSLDPLNAHRTIRIDQATLTQAHMVLTRCMAADQRKVRFGWPQEHNPPSMAYSRVYDIPCKASRSVDQEAAYRSFLHLRIFFLLTILLPQKNRETG